MKKYILIVLLIILYNCFVYSKPSDRIKFYSNELSNIEEIFFSNVDENKIDLQTYYDGFLIASSITNESDFLFYRDKINEIRLRAMENMLQYQNESDYNKGKILLKWLYTSNILKKYYLSSTLANHLIDSGSYNCLSSTIIYTLLATELGLDVNAVFTPNHSFATLKTEKGEIDVETTVEYGFDPGTEEIEEFENQQRIIYVPKTNYGNRKNVDLNFLISSLYANTISLIPTYNINNLAAYKKGFYLSPNEKLFQNNIVITLNNKAIDNIDTKNYEEAIVYLEDALHFEPNSEITKYNIVYFYQTKGSEYLDKNDFASAINIFKNALKETDNNTSIMHNLKVSYYNYIRNEYDANRFENAKIILSRAFLIFPNDGDFRYLEDLLY